ncbi:hypothetical protein lbkm_1849 [Lachnospiraceae bacterium KM106-2]|nr:hypothetical protein lbkm_1849 [Lachnospiraceae bacterium KM106-2]
MTFPRNPAKKNNWMENENIALGREINIILLVSLNMRNELFGQN